MFLGVALPIFTACFLCLVVTVLIWFLLRKKRSSVLILGICDSGKTTLFAQLHHGVTMPTHTSLKENIGKFETEKEILTLIDVPGHEKVRYECFGKFKCDTRASLFVIDSKNIQTELKDVAEFMYNVLTDPEIVSCRPKVLVVCNKQDCTSAKGSVVVRSLLEKELNTLMLTRTGALAGLDQTSKSVQVTLTKPGTVFTFSTSRLPIEFAECSALSDVSPIKIWLKSV
ncbi:Signal recognition particle receptor subunit beta [Clonorchis sinensis]|uniref:Signal recognition particle receptor subunit beta n=1 Tax=Clonorchis sinensis TaxID=79923 RepID=A0A419PZS1_CLOSI|nr:Signal recognition particle receptor subunit beta [Clonorchis sinensis]